MRISSSLRRVVVTAAGLILIANAAGAQTPAPAADRGYAMAVGDSSFGNVTSQSYGAEIGVTLRPAIQVFGSFGNVRDVSTSEIKAGAATIAGALAQLQSGSVTYAVKEPVTFFLGGVRYRFQVKSSVQPYVNGGVGVGLVHKNVTFSIGGADASSTISQLVTLGSDISGDESALMFSVGGGVVWPVWRQLILDLHFNYGRVSADTPISIGRAGLGVGVRF